MTENAKRRVVIVDDSLQTHDELNYLIKKYHPDLEVVGDFEDPILAMPIVESSQVEAVFLDINFEQQGKTLGLELAKHISRLPKAPWIIFVTGHPELEGPDIPRRPFGFITKPITAIKLARAINEIPIPPSERSLPPEPIIVHYQIIKIIDGKVVREFRTRFLAPKEIKYVQSNQGINTVKVYLVNGEVLDYVTLRLNKWLDFKLPCFVQISKFAIVHLKYVSGYRSDPSRFDEHLLTFSDDPTELPIGKTYFKAFRDALRMGKSCCG